MSRPSARLLGVATQTNNSTFCNLSCKHLNKRLAGTCNLNCMRLLQDSKVLSPQCDASLVFLIFDLYVCMCAHACVHASLCPCVLLYLLSMCVCFYVHVRMYVCLLLCVHFFICAVYAFVHSLLCVYHVCLLVCLCMCTCILVFVHVCILRLHAFACVFACFLVGMCIIYRLTFGFLPITYEPCSQVEPIDACLAPNVP